MQRKKYRKHTNPIVASLIKDLRHLSTKHKVSIWRRVSQLLDRPARRRIAVNLSKIDRYAADEEAVVVPGKVLAAGNLTKGITIGAVSFSEAAKTKIAEANGKAVTILELAKKHPKGSKVRILV